MNALSLYNAMVTAIAEDGLKRPPGDKTSPVTSDTFEAIGRQFMFLSEYNLVPGCDARWAAASVLHFFTGIEQAGPLFKYNRHASKFIGKDQVWHGAYGAAALASLQLCIKALTRNKFTRRALLSMPDLRSGESVNSPPCWNTMHFLVVEQSLLRMLVYQRSLNLAVMPYDLALFSCVHQFVADLLTMEVGSLHWTVGSLHSVERPQLRLGLPGKLRLNVNLLCDPGCCWEELMRDGDSIPKEVK